MTREKKEGIICEGFIGLLEIVAKIKQTTAICEYWMEKMQSENKLQNMQ